MILPTPSVDRSRLLRLAALVAVAAVPAALVVLDRWLDYAPVRTLWRDALWCRAPALCASAWPSYFAVVFGAVFAVLAVFVVRREGGAVSRPAAELPLSLAPVGLRQARLSKWLAWAGLALVGVSFVRALLGLWGRLPEGPLWLGGLPGIDLASGVLLMALGAGIALVPAPVARAAWRRDGRRWRSQAVAALAILAALWAVYTRPAGGAWLAVALAGAVVALVWRDLRASGPAFWLALLALVLASLHLAAWWRVVVGDEYNFYYEASDVAFRRPLAETLAFLFDGTWVYGTHPFLSTLLQALGLRVLGDTVFGWRIQDALLVALALPLWFGFVAAFTRWRLAALTAVFLATSTYLAAFSKIGYNNLQAYLALAVVLAAGALAVRTRRRAASLLLGLAMGACFYTFPAALYVVPLPVFLLALYDPPTARAAARRWATVAAATLSLAWPVLVQSDYWAARVTGTVVNDPRLMAGAGTVVSHVVHNLAYSLFSWLYAVDESHFVVVGHTDPITGTLLLLGLGCALVAVRWRDRFALFMLGTGFLMLVLAGATHDKIAPPATRMFMLVPWYAWLAALGLAWLVDAVAAAMPGWLATPRAGRLVTAGLAVALAVLVVVSYAQAYPLARRRLAGRYQPMEAQFVRLARQEERGRQPDDPPPDWVFLYPTDTLDPAAYRQISRLYQLAPAAVDTVDPTHPDSAPRARDLLAGPNVIAVVRPDMDSAVAVRFGDALRNGNFAACAVRNEAGKAVATLWLPPGQGPLCRPGD
jgi:hypothetical protein